MGKTGKALKRRRLAEQASLATASALDENDHLSSSFEQDSPPASTSSASFLQGLISPQHLSVTIQTLQTLTKHPELLKDQIAKSELKSLRGAIYDYTKLQNDSSTNASLTSKISSSLSLKKYDDALVHLYELRIRRQKPKLGSLQRWVREADCASRPDGSFGDKQVLKVLDAILRCCGEETEEGQEDGEGEEVVRRWDEWKARELSGIDVYDDIKNGRLPAPEDKPRLASQFRLLHETPGSERLPPNHCPAYQYTTYPSSIALSPTTSASVARVAVPNVPGAFLLTDILLIEECRHILASAEAIGFSPDRPIGPQQSVLAHNLYWLADADFMKTLNSRLLHLLPQEIDGGKVIGVNARFRVYRYVPGSIYRPHLDGAAPPSGLSPSNTFQFDTSPPSAPQMSRLTFLIYLNDKFTNGCTTFFLPSPNQVSKLNAYPIKPIMGSALVFPHGDSIGSLLHEGSPVEGVGEAKYVVRTEVVYEVPEGRRGGAAVETGREGG